MPNEPRFADQPATSGTPERPEEGSPFAIGLLLRQAHDRVAAATDGAVVPFGIERRHLMAMMRLQAVGPLSQRELVAQTSHDKASIVRIVDDLERLELAARTLVSGDRRLRAVTLTEHGHDVLAQARRAAEPAVATATASLSPAQTQQLRRLLHTMVAP